MGDRYLHARVPARILGLNRVRAVPHGDGETRGFAHRDRDGTVNGKSFFEHLVRYSRYCYSQLGQDLWVLDTLGYPGRGFFVEVGAADGWNISNSLLLEKAGWRGLLVEPAPFFAPLLARYRTVPVIPRCVWNRDGEDVAFRHVRDRPEFSQMERVAGTDGHDAAGRRAQADVLHVKTVRLVTLLERFNAPAVIDYLSIDTEGSEPEIVEDLPLHRYGVRLISVEHNYGENRKRIRLHLERNGFRRVLEEFSLFDDWYVHPEHLPESASQRDPEQFFRDLPRIAGTLPPVGEGVGALCERLAGRLQREGRIDEARSLLETFLAVHPGQVTVLCKAAELQTAAEETGRRTPPVQLSERPAVRAAGYLRESGRLAEAVRLLRQAARLDPQDEETHDALLETLVRWRRHGTEGAALPAADDVEKRIEIAVSGRRCLDGMPRVAGAGDIVEREGARCQLMYDGTLVPEDRYYGHWMTRLIARLGGHHEPQEERVFFEVLQALQPGGRMLELGCYWGFYTASFLRHFSGDARAAMMEPDLRKLAVGRETLRMNGLTADLLWGAIPPVPKGLGIQTDGRGAGGPTPGFSVDAFMDAAAWEDITILHADIQGAEVALMEDIGKRLRQREIKYLFVSTHGARAHAACLDAVRAAGYFLVAEHDNFESFSYDGLVVARSPDTKGPAYLDLPLRSPSLETLELVDRFVEAMAHEGRR